MVSGERPDYARLWWKMATINLQNATPDGECKKRTKLPTRLITTKRTSCPSLNNVSMLIQMKEKKPILGAPEI